MVHLIQRAADFGRAPAIVDQAGEHTFTGLDQAARRIAACLSGTLSRPSGSRVALLIAPGFEYVATLWGIWRAGATAVPLCLSHPPPEIHFALKDTGAELAVAGSGALELLQKGASGTDCAVLAGKDLGRSKENRRKDVSTAADAMILYTSGSTGKPKGVVLSHANLEAQIKMLCSAWGWARSDRILHTLPLHHTHGIVNALLCSLWTGAVCEFLPRFEAASAWHRLASSEITLFMAVPTMYARLIAHWKGLAREEREVLGRGCAQLRLMVSGSAALPVEVFHEWKEMTGHTLLERYGMTEIGMALSNPLQGQRRAGTVGAPLPGVEIRRITEDGAALTRDDIPGEIEVKGPAVFEQYWQRPRETGESFHDGWFRTGDVAIIEDGYWKILGRKSVDIIKTGGYKVSALEVENVLSSHRLIQECAVIGVADKVWGQRVCAIVSLEQGQALELEDLRSWSKERLAPYKVPTRLVILDSLPRNPMGKVVKPLLLEMLSDGPEAAGTRNG